MKRSLVAAAFIAAFAFAACNKTAESTPEANDSLNEVVAPATDSLKKDSLAAPVDTTKKESAPVAPAK